MPKHWEKKSSILSDRMVRQRFNHADIQGALDAAGTFWCYEDSATENNQRQPSTIRIPALRIIGDQNRICNNTFLNRSAESVQIYGNGNILMGNIADGDVYICGDGNVVSSLVFTTTDARLVLEGTAKTTTILQGVEDWRIVRK